jgi:uncharacterized protein YndB with AHSA1/START domain
MLDAPVERVWELIGNVRRHPEWWPRVEEVQAEVLEEGSTYRQVTKRLGKTVETTMSIERLEDSHELDIRCIDTGFYARYVITPAGDGTFVDAELGMEPRGVSGLFDGAFVRRWLAQSLDGLRRASADEQPGDERGEPASDEHR